MTDVAASAQPKTSTRTLSQWDESALKKGACAPQLQFFSDIAFTLQGSLQLTDRPTVYTKELGTSGPSKNCTFLFNKVGRFVKGYFVTDIA